MIKQRENFAAKVQLMTNEDGQARDFRVSKRRLIVEVSKWRLIVEVTKGKLIDCGGEHAKTDCGGKQ